MTTGGYEDGGGGIYAYSTLTLTNSTISGNSATVSGTYAGGGGLYSDGSLSISGSTISGNALLGSMPSGSGGGGIFIFDGGYVLNSTITGNSSSRDGGGVQNDDTSLTFANATIYGNVATATGGNLSNADGMGLANTIVAGGVAPTGPDISNPGGLTSYDYNIIATPVAGNAITGTTTNNQQVNPLLLALSNNGGPTFTNADTSASPGRADIPFAASTCNGSTGTNVDQRGFARGAGGRCDVSAYKSPALRARLAQRRTRRFTPTTITLHTASGTSTRSPGAVKELNMKRSDFRYPGVPGRLQRHGQRRGQPLLAGGPVEITQNAATDAGGAVGSLPVA